MVSRQLNIDLIIVCVFRVSDASVRRKPLFDSIKHIAKKKVALLVVNFIPIIYKH